MEGRRFSLSLERTREQTHGHEYDAWGDPASFLVYRPLLLGSVFDSECLEGDQSHSQYSIVMDEYTAIHSRRSMVVLQGGITEGFPLQECD